MKTVYVVNKVKRLAFSAAKVLINEGFVSLIQKIKRKVGSKDNNFFFTYPNWILDNEPSEIELNNQRLKAEEFEYKPLISVIMPVWNTPTNILHESIESVLKQTYDYWELCIANGSPENDAVRKLLDRYAREDSRIKAIHLDKNLGIAGNTNAAVKLSTGEFCGFLDHDDLLTPFALFSILEVLAQNPNVDLVYSDEDKITENNQERYNPYFKPAFSPDLLRSINYMCHLLVIRRTIGDEVGWIQEGFEGAQDYDLVLRVAEKARVIAHCPRILYHWRAMPGSTALATNEKSYATVSGIKALENHINRMNLTGKVRQGFAPTTYRVSYVFDNSILVSIIIPNRDHADDLELCITSILEKSTYKNFEILIVENNSQEEATFSLYQKLTQHENIKVIEYNEVPFNYSNINNFAASHTQEHVLLFLNNDIEVITPDWLECMLEHVCRPEVGIVGAKLYYPDDTIQHGGIIIGMGGIAGHGHKHLPRTSPGYFGLLQLQQNVSAVTAACLMIKREVFFELQGFDPAFQLAFGDVDLCMKVREKGYLVVWTPYAELYHHESKTRGYEDTKEKIKRFNAEIVTFKQKWAAILKKGDEHYNPNLSLAREDFSINLISHHNLFRITSGF